MLSQDSFRTVVGVLIYRRLAKVSLSYVSEFWHKENLCYQKPVCLFRRAWHVFLTCPENRTQRGPLALNYIRVGILARCRTSGWLFKPKLNSHFSQAKAFRIPSLSLNVLEVVVLEPCQDQTVFPKQNRHLHALIWWISMINGCHFPPFPIKTTI